MKRARDPARGVCPKCRKVIDTAPGWLLAVEFVGGGFQHKRCPKNSRSRGGRRK